MKLKYLILIFLLASFKDDKLKICEIKLCHPIDFLLKMEFDTLKSKGIDTIVTYRHWQWTNGTNGYGKIIWRSNGVEFEKLIRFEDHPKCSGKIETELINVSNNSIIDFLLENRIDTTQKPVVKYGRSHDAEHLIQIQFGDAEFCYTMQGMEAYKNKERIRSKLVMKLAVEDIIPIKIIDGKRVKY